MSDDDDEDDDDFTMDIDESLMVTDVTAETFGATPPVVWKFKPSPRKGGSPVTVITGKTGTPSKKANPERSAIGTESPSTSKNLKPKFSKMFGIPVDSELTLQYLAGECC